jgi:NAD-dependent DNA ligase
MLKPLLLKTKPNATLKSKKLKLVTQDTLKPIAPAPLPPPQPTMPIIQKRLNEVFITILNELSEFMAKKGEHFRSKAYSNAALEIVKYPHSIYTINDVKQIKNIGVTIMSKFEEYINTGKVEALENERNDPVNLFTNIYGVGPSKAKQLVALGIKTIEELKSHEQLKELLNSKQLIGLKYYEDILQKIPRSEIIEFEAMFQEKIKQIDQDTEFQIVGSFRRGLDFSSDIDIIITNKKNDSKIFTTILDSLIKDGTIAEVLSKGKVKCLTLIRNKIDMPMRRVDFLYSPPKEYPFALLYFTGSKIFNTLVRQTANDLGYTLNEHALSYLKDGIKGEPVEEELLSEESILNFLGIAYIKPENRIAADSLIKLTNTDIDKSPEIAAEAAIAAETALPEAAKAAPSESSDDSDADESKSLLPVIVANTPKNKTIKKSKDSFSITTEITSFKKNGIALLQVLTEDQLSKIIDYANNKYYCDEEPVLTDSEYDIIREYVLEKYPNNEIAKSGHTKCKVTITKNKVKLPYELWSMDKIKPTTNEVAKWTATYTGPYVISAKLDGISALYVNNKNESKLYTRGNGVFGQDISHLIPYLIKKEYKDMAFRGEIIITKDNFNTHYKSFANARNFVSGVVNKKTIDPNVLKHIDFVAYELINPMVVPSQQIKMFEVNGINHVKCEINNSISNEFLSERLLKWRKEYQYDIDGLVVINDAIYPRPKQNPEFAFAFKMVISEQIAEAKVVDVLWTPSKDGYIKPRVQIEKITLGGVTIEYATGFNAKFIEDNKIGIGAIITIIRSGDVIPHIVNVVVPAEYVKFPDIKYTWNDKHVDIILEDKENNSIVKEKNLLLFFKNLEISGIGPGNIKRIADAGFNSIPKILAMKKEDFLKVEGFKEKTATKLFEGIQTQIEKASLAKLLAASNIFGRGFGEITFNKILTNYPDILTSPENDTIKRTKLLKVEGIASKTADKFISHIQEFLDFITTASLEYKIKSQVPAQVPAQAPAQAIVSELNNKQIVLTSFRDIKLSQKIKELGGIMSDYVNKNTFVVIVKENIDEETTKTKKAKKLNIPIMTKSMFEQTYIV